MSRPLAGHQLADLDAEGTGSHASALLASLGAAGSQGPGELWSTPEQAVRASMDGAGRVCTALSRRLGGDLPVHGPSLLDRGGRATDDGGDRGPPGGRARLLRAGDGLVAVNLPRPSDWEAVPAWLRWTRPDPAGWADVAADVRHRPTRTLAARAGELGLAVTPCPAPGVAPADVQARHRHGRDPLAPWVLEGSGGGPPRRLADLRVVDLSALWAGPLLGALLARSGAEVVKVEDPRRGDVSRPRPTPLAQWLNRSKRVVRARFDRAGRDRLARLLADADVVIESARPRALDGLGLGPRHGLGSTQIWVSITAHGRTGPWSGRAGFGDDAAAGGGLYHGGPRATFVGDAVADPLTGLHGAVAVLAALLTGWSGHIDLALRDTAATVAARWAGSSTAAVGDRS